MVSSTRPVVRLISVLLEMDGAVIDQLEMGRSDPRRFLDIATEGDKSIAAVVNAERMPLRVARALWHHDASLPLGCRAAGDLVCVVIP